jgi:hypothetical protein
MSIEIDIPPTNFSGAIMHVTVEGGESSVIVETPDAYSFQWRADFGTDPTKAQMRLFGEVSVTRLEIEALNAARPLAQMSQRALARNTLGLVRQKIVAQIQELFRKEPTP